MIELDGAQGEGGGQILRSALTLSMITGTPFRIKNIRANRPKPGLMRQHLVAVQAAARVCNADVGAVELGARELEFRPGPVVGGTYEFAIGSAGSCTLVLQTVLPALMYADAPSTVRLSGGTHNPMAPPAQFLQRAYGRVLREMGVNLEIDLQRFGFFPAGGGQIVARIKPCANLAVLDLCERGELMQAYAESAIAAVPGNVAERELEVVGQAMAWKPAQLKVLGMPNEHGPGNALMLTLEYEYATEVVCQLGEKNLRAEAVAQRAVQEARDYIASGAALGEHLADQVMLPMALAGGGRYTTQVLSQHTLTNADVISRYLPVRFVFTEQEGRHLVEVVKVE